MLKHILLIDESITIHKIVELTLDKSKYELHSAYDIDQGSAQSGHLENGFILLDHKFALNKEYLESLKTSSQGNVLLLLVNSFEQYLSITSDVRVDGYIIKPINANSLNQTLLKFTGSSSKNESSKKEDNSGKETTNNNGSEDEEINFSSEIEKAILSNAIKPYDNNHNDTVNNDSVSADNPVGSPHREHLSESSSNTEKPVNKLPTDKNTLPASFKYKQGIIGDKVYTGKYVPINEVDIDDPLYKKPYKFIHPDNPDKLKSSGIEFLNSTDNSLEENSVPLYNPINSSPEKHPSPVFSQDPDKITKQEPELLKNLYNLLSDPKNTMEEKAEIAAEITNIKEQAELSTLYEELSTDTDYTTKVEQNKNEDETHEKDLSIKASVNEIKQDVAVDDIKMDNTTQKESVSNFAENLSDNTLSVETTEDSEDELIQVPSAFVKAAKDFKQSKVSESDSSIQGVLNFNISKKDFEQIIYNSLHTAELGAVLKTLVNQLLKEKIEILLPAIAEEIIKKEIEKYKENS